MEEDDGVLQMDGNISLVDGGTSAKEDMGNDALEGSSSQDWSDSRPLVPLEWSDDPGLNSSPPTLLQIKQQLGEMNNYNVWKKMKHPKK